MRKLFVAALLAGSVATPALAQDATSFTGPRIEGVVGYDILKSGESDDDGVDTSTNNGDESVEGVSYGVAAGYDFDLGSVVAGIEAEYADSSGEQEGDETLDGINFTSSVETGRDIYVGARLGFRATPSTLVYVKGGYTNTSIEANYATASDAYEFDTNADGWRLGAGIEQLFGPNLYGKLEYRYSNYNNLDFSDDFDLDNFDAENFDTDINLDRHQIMAGLGFRF